MPLRNLKSEELADYSFQSLKILTRRIQRTTLYVPSGQIPRRDVVHASLFCFGQIMTNNVNS